MRVVVAFAILGASLVALSASVVLMLSKGVTSGGEGLVAAGCAAAFATSIPFALWLLETGRPPPAP